ncbi:hypothetical protein RSOL_103080 [Rhizoctonia solani AG-3 Rhs1AP]|uniref:Uncharacterized protein n=2 Tax=Rhizoctonia solani TaxID=456999 RepID=X8J142_9AGAM|nr:hypothetical protein RSOL_103080 [Rhizoctonia solani AG-3 Rhs1AP]
MALLAQSEWGRSLDQYVGSYSREEMEKWPSELDKQQLHRTQEAIERIRQVDLGSATAINHVDLSDLEIVIRSSRSAAIYPYFATSDLVRGCIHLMSNLPLSLEERQSPFSYEYGYLCFRILIIAIGACLVDRSRGGGHFQEAMGKINTNPETEPLLYLSRRVMSVVLDLVDHSGGFQDSYNCILGWSRCSECNDEEELVARTDASTLLAMLWADSRRFSKAMFWTYSPGISGVVYLLWRYACYERHLKDQPSPDRYMIPFVDIYWRCTLSTTPDQTLALSFLRKANVHPAEIWDDMPIKPELGDTKLIIQAALHQLNLASTSFRAPDYPLQPEDVPNMLDFVRRHWLPECIDLLPSLFGAIINRMWVAFLRVLTPFSVPSNNCCDDSGYLEDLNKSGTHDAIKTEVLIQILKNGLVDFIGRTMLYLNPTTIAPEAEHDEASSNMRLLWECEHIFKAIRLLPPHGVFKDYFDTCGMSWWKLYWHLDSLSEPSNLGPDFTPFYKVCKNVWLGMRPGVGQIYSPTCKYARCPSPTIQRGLEYYCGHCIKRTYCSIQCQQK